MSAPSQTGACNTALAHLGESRRITTISDGTPLAKQFEQTWDDAIEAVLADHPWNFAVSRESLAVSADFTPEGSQYTQAFEKPANSLRWLPWREDHADYFAGEEEGNYILSNADAPIVARFIMRIDNLSSWSPGARAALSVKLAEINAKAITGQGTMIERMAELYADTLSKAKRQDGSASGERRRTLSSRSDWLNSRQRPFTGSVR